MKKLLYIASAFLVSGFFSAQQLDLNAMPKPGPTPTINITKPKIFQLKNGLTVMVVENNKLPRVNMNLTIDRPPVLEGKIAGVNAIMADQLGNGTANLSKDEFNKKIDYLGASLDFNAKGAFTNSLSKYFPKVVELMADAIVNPKFSAEELQKAKDREIENLKSSEKSVNFIAQNVSNALAYGKDTSRGEIETQETVKNIQLADVQNAYQKNFAPNNAYLVVVGDVKFNEVKKLIEKNFANWKKSATVYPALEPANNLSATEIDVVDVPNAVQSVIQIGNLTDLKMNDPQFFASTIASYILGGGAESRLFMNLREKNGFTYGAYSSLDTSKYSPSFSAESSVRNEVTDKAIKEFMNELNAISTIKPEELENAKSKIKGNFIMSLEKPETIAKFALNQKIQNLPDDFYANYLKSIDKVTVSDISKAVKSTIRPNQSRIFVAGKASQIAEGLEKLGYPVKYFDKDANPVEKTISQKVDANVTPTAIAEKYITAIGGKANVSKINTLTTEASTKMQGMDISLKFIQGKGGKNYQNISAMGQTFQKIVFDGKEGYTESRGQKAPLPDDEKAYLMKNTEIFPELNFTPENHKVTGIEKIEGEDAYAVKANDGSAIYYYSVKTGLKTGETKMKKNNGNEIAIPTVFSDYKDVSGVLMPYKISQTMMGQNMEIIVKSHQINTATDTDFK